MHDEVGIGRSKNTYISYHLNLENLVKTLCDTSLDLREEVLAKYCNNL